jgi:hypothetical protein
MMNENLASMYSICSAITALTIATRPAQTFHPASEYR